MSEKENTKKNQAAVYDQSVQMSKEERKQWFKNQWKKGDPILKGIMDEVKKDRK
ncbi:hypothetical protein [Bacillus testis]|uniref:hypothetical protein n=1 Tax=Bacillus testis TaxID=1622072 RepID=UPI0012B56B5A|nr:hypothetical protein [Bacillus testis]